MNDTPAAEFHSHAVLDPALRGSLERRYALNASGIKGKERTCICGELLPVNARIHAGWGFDGDSRCSAGAAED